MSIGQRLRTLRKSCGVTQIELADRSGVGHRTIQDIELSRTSPTVSTIEALAGALGVPTTALFAAPGPPTNPDHLQDAIDVLSAWQKAAPPQRALAMAVLTLDAAHLADYPSLGGSLESVLKVR